MKTFKVTLLLLTGLFLLVSPMTLKADGSDKEPAYLKMAESAKFKGDLRLRFDTQQRDEGPDKQSDRRRWRYRFRFGVSASPLDVLDVGFRLASGAGEQNTTNQSYGDYARGKEIWIDQIYADWKPADGLKITGGKFKNAFLTSALVWDPDVNLEGLNLYYKYDEGTIRPFFNVTHFFVEELNIKTASDADPVMGGYQGGITLHPRKNVSLDLGAAYYNFRNLDLLEENQSLTAYSTDHSQQMIYNADGKLLNQFNCFEVTAKFKARNVLPVPLSVFMTYVRNMDADIARLRNRGVATAQSDPADLAVYGSDNRDTGYQFGASVGSDRKAKDIYVNYFYQVLEDYAFPAAFVDSDFHGGGTNNKGHRVTANYFLSDNVELQGVFFFTRRESEAKDGQKDENRVQLDAIIKF